MKVLFLDCDGVINSHQSFLMKKSEISETADKLSPVEEMCKMTDSYLMWNLKFILNSVPFLQVVISSTWGRHFTLENFRDWVESYGISRIRVEGITPRKMSSEKREEINFYLKDHPEVEEFLVLDDRQLYNLDDPMNNWFYKTSGLVGLIYTDSLHIIWKFDKKFEPPLIMI